MFIKRIYVMLLIMCLVQVFLSSARTTPMPIWKDVEIMRKYIAIFPEIVNMTAKELGLPDGITLNDPIYQLNTSTETVPPTTTSATDATTAISGVITSATSDTSINSTNTLALTTPLTDTVTSSSSSITADTSPLKTTQSSTTDTIVKVSEAAATDTGSVQTTPDLHHFVTFTNRVKNLTTLSANIENFTAEYTSSYSVDDLKSDNLTAIALDHVSKETTITSMLEDNTDISDLKPTNISTLIWFPILNNGDVALFSYCCSTHDANGLLGEFYFDCIADSLDLNPEYFNWKEHDTTPKVRVAQNNSACEEIKMLSSTRIVVNGSAQNTTNLKEAIDFLVNKVKLDIETSSVRVIDVYETTITTISQAPTFKTNYSTMTSSVDIKPDSTTLHVRTDATLNTIGFETTEPMYSGSGDFDFETILSTKSINNTSAHSSPSITPKVINSIKNTTKVITTPYPITEKQSEITSINLDFFTTSSDTFIPISNFSSLYTTPSASETTTDFDIFESSGSTSAENDTVNEEMRHTTISEYSDIEVSTFGGSGIGEVEETTERHEVTETTSTTMLITTASRFITDMSNYTSSRANFMYSTTSMSSNRIHNTSSTTPLQQMTSSPHSSISINSITKKTTTQTSEPQHSLVPNTTSLVTTEPRETSTISHERETFALNTNRTTMRTYNNHIFIEVPLQYSLCMVLLITEKVNIADTLFVKDIEVNLARAYDMAMNRFLNLKVSNKHRNKRDESSMNTKALVSEMNRLTDYSVESKFGIKSRDQWVDSEYAENIINLLSEDELSTILKYPLLGDVETVSSEVITSASAVPWMATTFVMLVIILIVTSLLLFAYKKWKEKDNVKIIQYDKPSADKWNGEKYNNRSTQPVKKPAPPSPPAENENVVKTKTFQGESSKVFTEEKLPRMEQIERTKSPLLMPSPITHLASTRDDIILPNAASSTLTFLPAITAKGFPLVMQTPIRANVEAEDDVEVYGDGIAELSEMRMRDLMRRIQRTEKLLDSMSVETEKKEEGENNEKNKRKENRKKRRNKRKREHKRLLRKLNKIDLKLRTVSPAPNTALPD